MIAKIMRFYGMSFFSCLELCMSEMIMLYEMITRIEAQECITKMMLADFPKMREDHRKKMHREMFEKAYPSDNKEITTEEFSRLINGR